MKTVVKIKGSVATSALQAGAENRIAEWPKIPTLPEVSAEAGEWQTRVFDLQIKRAAIEAEIQDLISKLEGAGGREQDAKKTARVQAFLSGIGAPEKVGQVASMRERLQAAREQRSALDEAIPQARRLMETAQSAARRTVCEIVRPQYAAIVEGIVRALLIVHEHQLAYHEFRDELESKDTSITLLGAMPPRMMGSPNDPQGSLGAYLKECAQAGLISEDLIPDELHWMGPRSDWPKSKRPAQLAQHRINTAARDAILDGDGWADA